MHCIIEAMVGRSSEVSLVAPVIEGVPPLVVGDPDRLRGILLNLYTNAAKFTRKGALALHISVSGPNFRPEPHVHTGDTAQNVQTGEGTVSGEGGDDCESTKKVRLAAAVRSCFPGSCSCCSQLSWRAR